MNEGYESYPVWIVLVSNLVSLSTYAIGAFIIYQFGLVWMLAYLAYIAFLEVRLLRGHCTDCYYHGKTCAFGKGRLSGVFFKKGDSKKFNHMKIGWKDILPDFLVSIVPMAAGAAILMTGFSWLILFLVVALGLLAFVGTGMVRGQLACKHCKQRQIGCPAEQLFSKRR